MEIFLEILKVFAGVLVAAIGAGFVYLAKRKHDQASAEIENLKAQDEIESNNYTKIEKLWERIDELDKIWRESLERERQLISENIQLNKKISELENDVKVLREENKQLKENVQALMLKLDETET